MANVWVGENYYIKNVYLLRELAFETSTVIRILLSVLFS